MIVHIQVFARLAEQMGGTVISVEIDPAALASDSGRKAVTAGQLKQLLQERYPDASASIGQSFFAKNQAYAGPDEPLNEGDELALIPPVSGGEPESGERQAVSVRESERYLLTAEPLSVEQVTANVIHPNHGAAIAFTGTTREITNGQRTVRLEYECYAPMALATMKQIGDELAARWPGALCSIAHRTGVVGIGEISVVIAVSLPHRAEAYEASRYAIERLKQIVPIWKKEIWEDGSEWKGHQLGPWNPLSEQQPSGAGGDSL